MELDEFGFEPDDATPVTISIDCAQLRAEAMRIWDSVDAVGPSYEAHEFREAIDLMQKSVILLQSALSELGVQDTPYSMDQLYQQLYGDDGKIKIDIPRNS
jgi:hypothetical protein